MTQQEMMFLVPRKLKEIEKEYGVRVLYAAESGSRAWGTSAEHSDFDVRFIYIRPRKEYLRLDPVRDVLEFPIEDGWDMSGWDLEKMLRLLHSSNSQIYEWFASPVVYVDDGFSQRIKPLLEACFSTKTAVHHYLHQEAMKMKQQKAELTKVKHYLYRFQHLAAAAWILAHQTPPPVGFMKLMEYLPEEAGRRALELLQLKTERQLLIPHDPWLDTWLQEERDRIGGQVKQLPKDPERDWEMLNSFFLAELERIGDL